MICVSVTLAIFSHLIVEGTGFHASSENNYVKEIKREVISTKPLNFDDYEMPAATPPPLLHLKMERFYQHVARRRQRNQPTIHESIASNLRENTLRKRPHGTRPSLDGVWIYDNYYDDLNSVREKKQVHVEKSLKKPDQESEKENDEKLLREYLEERQQNNKTSNYGQETEDGEDMLLSEKTQKPNCTEDIGYGLQAVSCVNKMEGKQQVHLVLKLILFWIGVTVMTIFILWCTKGWCSCLCPCQFNKVDERLDMIHRYIAHNPPGEWNQGGISHQYEPTANEVFIYEQISRAFMDI